MDGRRSPSPVAATASIATTCGASAGTASRIVFALAAVLIRAACQDQPACSSTPIAHHGRFTLQAERSLLGDHPGNPVPRRGARRRPAEGALPPAAQDEADPPESGVASGRLRAPLLPE